jgi:hypothetical protein
MKSITQKKRFRMIGLYYGIYSRVARGLGVSPSIVRRVATHKAVSSRITKALEAEIRRIDEEAKNVA